MEISSFPVHKISRSECTIHRIRTVGNIIRLFCILSDNGQLPMLLSVRTTNGWPTVLFEALSASRLQIQRQAVSPTFWIFQIWVGEAVGDVEVSTEDIVILVYV